MTAACVLLVSSDRQFREHFLKAAWEKDPNTKFEAVARDHEAIGLLAGQACRAMVCVVESPDEIARVLRLRRARPDLPLVMLTSIANPAFEGIGEQMGADLVLRQRGDLRRNAEGLLRALETRDTVRATRRYATRAKEIGRDIHRMGRRTRDLVAEALGHAAACEPGNFVTLIVDDAVSDVLLLTRALKRAGLPPFSRTAQSAEDAFRYFRAECEFHDRSKFPIPKLIISDLNLPGRSGLDLLWFVRGEPALRPTGFILHTSSERAEDLEEAVRLGANFYVLKSVNPEPLVEIVDSIFTRFVQNRSGMAP